jgi:hypothetical protein
MSMNQSRRPFLTTDLAYNHREMGANNLQMQPIFEKFRATSPASREAFRFFQPTRKATFPVSGERTGIL